MNWLGKLLGVGRSTDIVVGAKTPPPETWRSNFDRQLALEAEGAAKGLKGAKREDCPYDKETQPFEWNHWVYGCEIAAGEAETIKSGSVMFCTTAKDAKPWAVPIERAIASGMWEPRYATVPSGATDAKMVKKST